MAKLGEARGTDLLMLEQLVKVNEKLGKLIELTVQNRGLTADILTVKERHHKDWMAATAKRFYVSLVTVVLMGSAFYVDIILEGRHSAFLNGLIDILNFWSV